MRMPRDVRNTEKTKPGVGGEEVLGSQPDFQSAGIVSTASGFFAIHIEDKSAPEGIAAAVAIEDQSKGVSAQGKPVQHEEIPAFGGQERTDGKDPVRKCGGNSAETCDDQIRIGGMTVIFSAFRNQSIALEAVSLPGLKDCTGKPLAGERIQILVDPWNDASVFAQEVAAGVRGRSV